MASSENYLYAFSSADFDDSKTYVYRQDKDGTILKAEINDLYYHYVDLAEVPRRVMEVFRTCSKLRWEPRETISEQVPFWGIPESNSDTGISFEAFKDIVLSRIPNSSYDKESGFFMVKVITATGSRLIRIPNATLKKLAQHNKYFEQTYWMA